MKFLIISILAVMLAPIAMAEGGKVRTGNVVLSDEECVVAQPNIEEQCELSAASEQSGIEVYFCQDTRLFCVTEPED